MPTSGLANTGNSYRWTNFTASTLCAIALKRRWKKIPIRASPKQSLHLHCPAAPRGGASIPHSTRAELQQNEAVSRRGTSNASVPPAVICKKCADRCPTLTRYRARQGTLVPCHNRHRIELSGQGAAGSVNRVDHSFGKQVMQWDHLEAILNQHLARIPFRVFVVELHGGKRYEIDHPHSIAMKDGVAVFIALGGIPVWFDHESVVQVIDAPADSAV